MVYHPKTIRVLAIVQIVIGALCIVFGIGIFFVDTNWRLQYIQDGGFGLWAGAWILATGLLGFFGSRDRQSPNKCILGTFLGFAITSCVMAGIMLISYAVALSYISRYRYRYGYHNWSYSYHFGPATGLSATFLIISIVEFFIAMASSVYCCSAFSCNGARLLLQGYRTRDNAIKGCITEVSERIKTLQQQRDRDPDDIQLIKNIRKHQTRLRLMQADLSVEEVIQQRSLKVFNERCWKSFKPPK